MKRALVSCAAFAILGAAACGSSNPTLPPGVAPLDSGASERGASMPPDLRPPAVEVGGSDTSVSGGRKDAADAPLTGDVATSGIDVAPPAIVTVSILAPVAGARADGGGATPPVIATSARLAPSVRVDVQSQGGNPTADVVTKVTASLLLEGATSSAADVTLNQTQYEVVPESNSKIYLYGDTPLGLGKLGTGSYTLVVTATTAGGTTATATMPLYLDTGPVINFLQPNDGIFVKGSVVVTAMVIDDHSGVASVEFSVGQAQVSPAAISSNGAQYSVTLDFGSFNPPLDGPQVVTITATNGNGVVSLATRKFTVDNQGPTISGTKPGTGELIGKLITIEAQVSDPAGVMEGSVVAVVAHGDVHFEVRLDKGSSGAYSKLFDTTQLPVYAIFPSISFRAQDTLGNQSSVGYLVSLDNTPPIMDLDPPDHVRLIKSDGTCSWPFDPVGPDAIDDGSVVAQLFDIRARVEDRGNTPLTGIPDFIPIAAVDPATVKILILDDTSLPLVVDTSDPPDGICDDINPELVPSVAPQSAKDAQLIDMVPLAKGGAGDFSHQPGVACSGTAEPPPALCDTTYSFEKNRVMTYSMGYAGSLNSIWTIPPIVGDNLQCAGRQFDASNNLHDGWACVAVEASDKLGNKQVSRPIRICVAAKPGSTACTAAGSGGADLASVSVPSSTSGQVLITTKAAVLGVGGLPVAKGDTLVFTNIAPPAVSFVGGDHTAEPQGGTGTQFLLTDVKPAPYDLWLDLNDGTNPQRKGPVGIVIADGVDVQVITDVAGTALDPTFAGYVILIMSGSTVASTDRRWSVSNIQSTGFSLKSSASPLTGFATPAAKLPNCTGTVVKSAAGAPAKVDGTIPCKPWAAFPEYEAIEE